MHFPEALAFVRHELEPHLAAFFQDSQKTFGSLDHTSAEIVRKLSTFCLGTGKQIRPFLVAVGASLASGKELKEVLREQRLITLMLAVQLTHARILIADDVADADKMRYGRPTVHKQWELDLRSREPYTRVSPQRLEYLCRSYTEISGIWLQAAIDARLSKDLHMLPEYSLIREIWLQYLYEHTCAGWMIHQEQNLEALSEETSLERFVTGLELVTADYTFVGPLVLGATLFSGSEDLKIALREYGKWAGTLFQLSDDVLGIFGDPAVTGKPAGNDVREGKKTVLLQYAYQSASPAQKQRLAELTGKTDIRDQEVEEVKALVVQTGALQKTHDMMSQYARRAETALAQLPALPATAILEELAEFLIEREK